MKRLFGFSQELLNRIVQYGSTERLALQEFPKEEFVIRYDKVTKRWVVFGK